MAEALVHVLAPLESWHCRVTIELGVAAVSCHALGEKSVCSTFSGIAYSPVNNRSVGRPTNGNTKYASRLSLFTPSFDRCTAQRVACHATRVFYRSRMLSSTCILSDWSLRLLLYPSLGMGQIAVGLVSLTRQRK